MFWKTDDAEIKFWMALIVGFILAVAILFWYFDLEKIAEYITVGALAVIILFAFGGVSLFCMIYGVIHHILYERNKEEKGHIRTK